MGHTFPNTEEQYRMMQQHIVRERVLANQVGALHVETAQGGANSGMYWTSEESTEFLLLCLCLGVSAGGEAAAHNVNTYLIEYGEWSLQQADSAM